MNANCSGTGGTNGAAGGERYKRTTDALERSERTIFFQSEKYPSVVAPRAMRDITKLLVGVALAVLAVAAFAPAVSAHGGTDAQAPTASNATAVQAQEMVTWMEYRMGPDGVAAFESQTGTTVEAVAVGFAQHMNPWGNNWTATDQRPGEPIAPGPGWNHHHPGWGDQRVQTPCGDGGEEGYGMGPGHGMRSGHRMGSSW